MTWVIATPTMFGYGFGMSDVRVTLGDGREIDCLQKIHAVGRYVAAGFAGSVEIGFRMIERLRDLAHLKDERLACDPLLIAERWPSFARQEFDSFPERVRADGCHLIVIATHPTEHTGNPAWARPYVYVFKSPEFALEPVPVHSLASIGSGSHFPACLDAVKSFSDFRRRELFEKGEVGTPGGMGTILGFNLTQILLQTQPEGVSAHLHYCWVYRGQIIIEVNDHVRKGRWCVVPHGCGARQDEKTLLDSVAPARGGEPFSMPRLATNWQALIELVDAMGCDPRSCIA